MDLRMSSRNGPGRNHLSERGAVKPGLVHDAHAALADPVLHGDDRLAALHPQRLPGLYQRVHDA
jgi:hypothetical protein